MDVIVRQYTDADAAGVAQMWNESSEGWPGGFLPFIDFTEPRVREKMREADFIALYIALLGDKVVGYCSLAQRSTDRNVSYIPLLNAHPDYHGHKIGKKVLLAALDVSIKRGFDRLDLHTWPGNVKAVPLYKKAGFFWVPETEVYMQNFMPLVFQNPIARRYFDKHNWYATQVRDLSTIQDRMSWRDRDAFLYEWRDGEDYLKIVIDRHCGGITCIETRDLHASSRLDAKAPAIGLTHRIAWQFSNRSEAPMRGSLRASGEEGLEVSKQASFDLAADHSLDAELRVGLDCPLKDKQERAPGVRADVVIDGESFTLKTGVRAKHAIELWHKPELISIAPGSCQTVSMGLRNRLSEPIDGRLHFLASESVSLEPSELSVRLDAEDVMGCSLKVTALASGAHVVRPVFEASLEGKKTLLPAKRFAIASVGPDEVVAALFEDQVLIQNDFLRLGGKPGKGWALVHTVEPESRAVALWTDRLGEPFSDEFLRLPFSVSIEDCDGAKVLVMKNKSEAFPGIELEKRISVGRGPLVKLEYVLRNLSTQEKNIKLKTGCFLAESSFKIAIPMKEGILNVHPTDFPAWEMDVPREPEAFAESWSAFERSDGIVAGLIWKDASKVQFGGRMMPALTFDPSPIPALGTKTVSPFYLYLGGGDFRTMRRHWARLMEQKPDDALPVLDSVVRLEASERPILMDRASHGVSMRLSHLRRAKCEGRITLAAPGFSAAPETVQFKDVTIEQPLDASVKLTAGGQTRVLPLEAAIETQVSSAKKVFSVFFAQTKSAKPEVKVESLPEVAGKKVVRIDNGELALLVSPDFAGSLISFRRKSRELLTSAFPEAKARSWFNPWFGGLRAAVRSHSDELWAEPDETYKVQFSHENCQRLDLGGHAWDGIRLVGEMVKDELRGLSLQVDYLTRPGSNVLAALPNVLNDTDAPARVWLTLECFPAWNQKDDFVTHYRVREKFFVRKTAGQGTEDIHSDGWLCAENFEHSQCLALVTKATDTMCSLIDLGAEEHFYFLCRNIWIAPRSSAGLPCTLTATETVAEAKLCLALQSLSFRES